MTYRKIALALVLFLLIVGCRTSTPSSRPASNFHSALLTVLRYAHDEGGQDFASCPRCEVRVIAAQSIEQYVKLDDSGFQGELRQRVESAIRENRGRAVVLANLKDGRNIVLLHLPQGTVPGSSDATGVLVSNGIARSCGLRTFGTTGSAHFCADCIWGFCCGTCRCTQCFGDITSATQGLDLPEPIMRLFNGPRELDAYALDTNLVRY